MACSTVLANLSYLSGIMTVPGEVSIGDFPLDLFVKLFVGGRPGRQNYGISLDGFPLPFFGRDHKAIKSNFVVSNLSEHCSSAALVLHQQLQKDPSPLQRTTSEKLAPSFSDSPCSSLNLIMLMPNVPGLCKVRSIWANEVSRNTCVRWSFG